MDDVYLKYFPDLDEKRHQQLHELKDYFLDWNSKINLISRKDTDAFEVNHVLHALSIAHYFQFVPGSRILDFGTGGGFPGLPLAIFFPQVHFTLVDSIGKKIMVVKDLVEKLDLKNVSAYADRVENINGKFDFVTCRAVGKIGKIMPWVRNKLNGGNRNPQPNGFIFLKGGDLAEELSETKLPFQRFSLHDHFEEPFFETKEIVYLSTQIKTKNNV